MQAPIQATIGHSHHQVLHSHVRAGFPFLCTRFEVLWRDAQIHYLEKLAQGDGKDTLDAWLEQRKHELLDDFAFVAACNIGGESMSDADIQRLHNMNVLTAKGIPASSMPPG